VLPVVLRAPGRAGQLVAGGVNGLDPLVQLGLAVRLPAGGLPQVLDDAVARLPDLGGGRRRRHPEQRVVRFGVDLDHEHRPLTLHPSGAARRSAAAGSPSPPAGGTPWPAGTGGPARRYRSWAGPASSSCTRNRRSRPLRGYRPSEDDAAATARSSVGRSRGWRRDSGTSVNPASSTRSTSRVRIASSSSPRGGNPRAS